MSTLAQVLDWHLEHYPLLQAADIYKLVHQSVFGPGHIVESADQCRKVLEHEFARLSSLPPDTATLAPVSETEPLDPEGELVRVNLAPLRAGSSMADALVSVLVETARTFVPVAGKMPARLAASVEWCRKRLPEQAVWLEEIADAAPREGFPPTHHSAAYEAAYRPAYRVVRRDLWEQAKR